MRDTEREAETQAEGEAGLACQERVQERQLSVGLKGDTDDSDLVMLGLSLYLCGCLSKFLQLRFKERISIGKYANHYYLCIVLITFKGGGNT